MLIYNNKMNSSSTSDGSDHEFALNRDQDEEITEEVRRNIRSKISTLSFEDLLKMKEEMGAKLYNETVLGVKKKKIKTDYKRANKNRPRELSSKIRPKQLNRVLNQSSAPMIEQNKPRDPRFDPLCGQFDARTFKSDYKFVHDIRLEEKKQLEKELKSCTDPSRQQIIKKLIQRINNQVREQDKKDKEERKEYQEKKEVKEKLKKGEKPVYKKKSVKKLENLIEKYNELKKSNKLQKHIEKRSKKLSIKEKRKMKSHDVHN
ncbi:unnamed protein product [Acanthoscelides obtectus]|uniref:rRNA biogenesis protein RRP36 n=1 Tax=Acanthoscelides obtectus TaxID=200917 RepID=A0A9P0JKW5_ACAOB|nr:unnamed protein product [Acanthoscelides obtectus]CAK1672810.1 Ribosomal RNA processing protein 36 homolog [Acanthoscelides obtectus]